MDEYENETELLDLIDQFVMHLGFAVYDDDVDHFIELFTPSFFEKIPQEEKFNSGIMAIGSIPNMQQKYLHRFIFDTCVSDKTLDDKSDENYWTRAGFTLAEIRSLFSLRELKTELPINETSIESKKPKI